MAQAPHCCATVNAATVCRRQAACSDLRAFTCHTGGKVGAKDAQLLDRFLLFQRGAENWTDRECMGKGEKERGNPWIWDTFLLSFLLFLRTLKYKCRTYLYVNSLINALPNQNWIVIDKIMINRSEEMKYIELSPVYAQMLHKNLYTICMISVCAVAEYTFSSSVSAAVAIIKVIYQLLISTLGNLSINHEWPR